MRFGESATGASENGHGALVALESGQRKVFWCDSEAKSARKSLSQGEILGAKI